MLSAGPTSGATELRSCDSTSNSITWCNGYIHSLPRLHKQHMSANVLIGGTVDLVMQRLSWVIPGVDASVDDISKY